MKKKLLISWGNPYQVYGSIIPLISQLAKNYSIHILFVDYRTPSSLFQLLDLMKKKQLIEQYWLLPDYWESYSFKHLLKHHWYVRKHLKIWREFDFDVWLSSDDFLPFQQYLRECVIPKRCAHICWIPGRTHLAVHQELAKMLLKCGDVNDALRQCKRQGQEGKNFFSYFQEGVKRFQKECSFDLLFKKTVQFILNKTLLRIKKRFVTCFDRILLPKIFVGKIFSFGPYDRWTQTGSGNCDALIFCDEIFAKAQAPLSQTSAVYVATYPTEGYCRCTGVQKDKSAILVLVEERFGEDMLALFCRDIQLVLSMTGCSVVHLRPHPRQEKKTAIRLSQWLKSCNIEAVFVENQKPIWEIICNYHTVLGPSSDGLRDARAACDYVNVICSAAFVDPVFKDPRFSLGELQAKIGWIEKDGSYDPNIFVRKKYDRPKRKTVPEILLELT